ncbi:MAG: D-2-hydroxyacid dehydrogenase [Rhodocyclaceae bacterium]|jgi:glycerate dehydrogenase|nr:Glycerate dehydrogenase [Rhodocyclaceae bacterium]MBZ0143885.1 D-2-hydroxyacid dehydrogenase [Rhodocyclaceae bacterium]MCC6878890.1 D-2-hydroxyacid dehydrogenase [Rhodocyclaceae bacterium]MCL4680856.1 D-2-hydroxyacid dehydrogenase [Rhodocyclaceae bacterium]
MRHRIVFLERDSIRGEFRRPDFPHDYDEYPLTAAADVAARVGEASIVITNKVVLRGELLAALPQLKMIACAATGTDNVDLDWCRSHGIVVSNIRGYAANTVPEHAIALAMALRRNLLAYRRDVQAGKWQRSSNFCFFDHPIRDLHGATLGLVGRGSLGEGVARLAEAFGMRVLWAEHKGVDAAKVSPGRTAFEDVLRQSDVVSLHCPLNAETRGLIGEAELRLMKPDAVLINTARGGIVDEAALARALKEGWIGGAGFDVLSQEPPREGNPLLELDLPNFILTPHVAWASAGAMQALLDQLTGNLEAFARGEPRNRVA